MNTDLLTEKRLRQDKQVFRSNLHVFIFEFSSVYFSRATEIF